MSLRLSSLLAVLALAGCSLPPIIPEPADGGFTLVPSSYQLARSTPGHRQHLALHGNQQLRCHDCHAVSDGGFVGATVAICADCHDSRLKQHHPLDAGITLPDGGLGPQLTCLSCHPFLAREQSRFEKWSCLSCHTRDQGDAGAITVHTSRCNECHKPHDTPFTQPQDCTTCHEVSLKHGAKGTTIADTCMKCHAHHTQAQAASVVCVDCHTKPTMELRARVAKDALFSPGHVGCGSCHHPHSFVKEQVATCSSCHKPRPVLVAEEHDECTSCHFPHASRSAAKDCQGCHDDQKVKHPKDKQGNTCKGCHPPHDVKLGKAKALDCLACHKEPEVNAQVVHASSAKCSDCHQPHDGKPKLDVLCKDCHAKEWKAAWSNTDKAHVKCESCHKGLPHKEPPEPPECLTCHRQQQPPFAGHRTKDVGCLTCHSLHDARTLKTCKDCHEVPKLPALHAEPKHQDCKTCHTPHDPQPGFGPATCTKGCHEKLTAKDHPPKPTQCIGCHLFKDASPDAKK